MASAIENVGGLPGATVWDHEGAKIGKVKRLYAAGDGGAVMWVTVETSLGIDDKREVFVPLARLKHEDDELRVPYTTRHIQSAPEVEAGEALSEGDDRALRDYYSIDLADQELRTDNDSYAGQVPVAEEGSARQIEADDARAPERDTGEGAERMRAGEGDGGPQLSDKPRQPTVGDVVGQD
jgi:ribosomal 30S subunit maturation factor RimM